MRDKNLIRIDNINQVVYRIFPLYRIQQLFQDNKLVLVRPEVWEDPFENFLLRCTAIDKDGTVARLDDLARSWYGLCWTLNADSDAMWRIYSPKKDGIRVKTTIRKLADMLWEPDNQFSSLKYFIGKVQYRTREEIEMFLRRTSFWDLAIGGQNLNFAETLLIKRTEFQHENEIRILANCKEDVPDARLAVDLYKIPANPNNLVDELCIDPRLGDNQVADITQSLKQFGYTGPIVQSELYKLSLTQIRMI